MKVDHASVNHLFLFLLSLCGKKKRGCSWSWPMIYGRMLVKPNILNDKETGNSKKDSVK